LPLRLGRKQKEAEVLAPFITNQFIAYYFLHKICPSAANIHVRANVADRVVGAHGIRTRSHRCATCRKKSVFIVGHGGQGIVQCCRSTPDETVWSPRVAVWIICRPRNNRAKCRLCSDQGLARRDLCWELGNDALAGSGREAKLLAEHHDRWGWTTQQLAGAGNVCRRDTVAGRLGRSLGAANSIAKRVEVGAISRVWD
jgi:hypothetical protein